MTLFKEGHKIDPEICLNNFIVELVEEIKPVFCEEFKEKYHSSVPGEWIIFQSLLIKRMPDCPPEDCYDLMVLCESASDFIIQLEGNAEKLLLIYRWETLIDFAREKDHRSIKDHCNHYGKIGLILGYTMVWLLATLRLYLYLESFPQSRDVLYTGYGKELEKDYKSKPYVEKALFNVSRKAKKMYKEIAGALPYSVGRGKIFGGPEDTTTPEQRIYSHVWGKAKKALAPLSNVKENLSRAAEGKLNYIPEAVKNELIDEYRKQDTSRIDIRQKKYLKNNELKFGTKYDLPENYQSLELLSDIPKLLEIERVSNLEKWVESIKNHQNQEIARLKFIEGLPVREITKKVLLSKSNVGRRIKKLQPPF